MDHKAWQNFLIFYERVASASMHRYNDANISTFRETMLLIKWHNSFQLDKRTSFKPVRYRNYWSLKGVVLKIGR